LQESAIKIKAFGGELIGDQECGQLIAIELLLGDGSCSVFTFTALNPTLSSRSHLSNVCQTI
jgi:hypothetical protein